jgi:hypothetical protein
MFKFGEKWYYFLCPKTYDFTNFCPWCAVTSKLYQGSQADKGLAYNLKRKVRFVSNWFVVDDPRDKDIEEDSEKSTGKVKLYEFPGKVEDKIKEEITDNKRGWGEAIFDPGELGCNFILKIGATKPDKDGKVWPDYSMSMFDRRQSAIAENDSDIEKIMQSTYSLDEYIRSLEKPIDNSIELLKQNMLWEYVKDDMSKLMGEMKSSQSETNEDSQNEDTPFEADPLFDVDDKKEEEPYTGDDIKSDEDLLKELEDM